MNTPFPPGFMILDMDHDASLASYRARSALLWGVAVLAYALLFQIFYNLIDDKVLWPYASASQACDFIFRNTLAIFVIFAVNYLIVFKLTNRNLPTAMKILTDMVFATLAMICVNLLYSVTLKINHTDWAGTSFNTVLTMLALETAYYVRHYQQSLHEKEELTLRMQEYRYMALKSQVNPHFLFNSLNILYALVRGSSDKSLTFIESLSNIYRYVLNHQNLDLVSLDCELDFAADYLQILTLRYVDAIEVDYDIPADARSLSMVPFTMQLLLENVVKHNVISKSSPMRICATVQDGCLVISNDLRPKKEAAAGGTGLAYLGQLYHIHGRTFRAERTPEAFIVYVPLI